MMDNVNEKKGKKNRNYPNTKKPLPISIVTGRDTIFIKTKPNKVAYNYINNGNQIKNNNILINSINRSSETNKSLINTFSLHKSNFAKSINGTTIETKNLNNSKIKEIIKIKKLSNNNVRKNIRYRGTNSFIKMNRRNNNSNISYNINNSSNHIFNFYTFMNKVNNNSSIKDKNKIKQKFDNKGFNNRNCKNNKFNFTYINDKKTSMIIDNRTNSKEKGVSKSINRTSYPQRYNYNNNNNLTNIRNKNYMPFRTIGYETENNYTIRGAKIYGPSQKYKLEYKKSKNNKYIYSIEKRKEKSLAEKRHDAKKPISYLSKNNIINKKDKDRHVKSNNTININNINYNNNNANKKEKEKNNRATSYNRIKYDFSTTNYKNKNGKNRNCEKENSIRITISNNEIYNANNTDINIKTSLNNNKKISLNNKNNLERSNTIENNINSKNNIVNNNNYYSINNTFIFDTAEHKLIQYDLSKLMPNSKNNHSMNINISDISNYNSSISNNLLKTNSTDIESNNNKIINRINKAENKVITKENKINKTDNNNNDYISVVINNNINNCKIQKYSSHKMSNTIKDKYNPNHLDIISHKNKFIISNVIKKESTKANNSIIYKFQKLNNNNNINNTISKDFIIKEYKYKKKKKIDKNKIFLNNKESSVNKKNKFYEQKSITNIYNNNASLYIKTLNRRKSDNICNYEGKSLLNKYNINNLINSKKETTNNSIQTNNNNKVIKDNYNSKEKDKPIEKIKGINKDKKIKENKIISYKIINFKKNKNKNIIINIDNNQKIRESKLKKLKKKEKDKTKNFQENKKEIKKGKKFINNYLDINNKCFKVYKTCGNNNENGNISIDSFGVENIMNKEQDKNDKNYTSFELISLSESRTNEDNNKFVDIPDNNELFLEDNFDDINSIIKKIDFYSIRNNPDDDIFSINNNKYKEYSKNFDKLFDVTTKINKKKNAIKKIN